MLEFRVSGFGVKGTRYRQGGTVSHITRMTPNIETRRSTMQGLRWLFGLEFRSSGDSCGFRDRSRGLRGLGRRVSRRCDSTHFFVCK